MTEVKKKSKHKGDADDDEACKLTKDEQEVAKFLLWGLPGKEGKLVGMKVKIFFADEALDYLMSSKFTKEGKDGSAPLFVERQTAVRFMNVLLAKRTFHRAAKIRKGKKKKIEVSSKNIVSDGDVIANKTENKEKKDKDKEKKQKEKLKKEEEKKKKGRPRLEMHDEQLFVDIPGEVYVWLYDPVRPRNFFIGFLMVLGSVAICLFPMWPMELKNGAYYASVGAIILMVSLMGLGFIRYPVYGLVWCLSFGKYHFWFLPNLTEDCGVLESFIPLFSINQNEAGAIKQNGSVTDLSSSTPPEGENAEVQENTELQKKEN